MRTSTIPQRAGDATLYELVAHHPEHPVLLIAYCHGQSRARLLKACCRHGQALARLTGTDQLTFARRAHDGATMGAWSIAWTGRTKRDALHEGEHAWIGDQEAT